MGDKRSIEWRIHCRLDVGLLSATPQDRRCPVGTRGRFGGSVQWVPGLARRRLSGQNLGLIVTP